MVSTNSAPETRRPHLLSSAFEPAEASEMLASLARPVTGYSRLCATGLPSRSATAFRSSQTRRFAPGGFRSR